MNNSTKFNFTIPCPSFGGKVFLFPQTHLYRYFLISVIVLNSLVALISSFSNFVIIFIFSKNVSFTTPSHVFILGLAVSDLGVAVISQPLYCAARFLEILGETTLYCSVNKVFQSTIWTFAAISFITLSAITIDRFLAVRLHLRYQELITTRRYGAILTATWFLCTLISLSRMMAFGDVLYIFGVALLVVLFLTNAVCIFKISRVIRRHSVQIQAQQQSVQQSIDMPKYKKSVNTMYYVIGAFLLCYVPFVATLFLLPFFKTREILVLNIVSVTLVMSNGVVNPVIYCWRISEIRNAVTRLMRRMLIFKEERNPENIDHTRGILRSTGENQQATLPT